MSTRRRTPPPDDAPLNPAELRLLAYRERNAQAQPESRARRAHERAEAKVAKNPTGYVVPAIPASLRDIRKWVREQPDAYSRRDITHVELTEVRRSASALGDLFRTGAELRKAEAQLRAVPCKNTTRLRG